MSARSLEKLLAPPVRAVLLDLDGTIFHEQHPLPGAVAFLDLLQRRGVPYACLTNSGCDPREIHERLIGAGIDIDEHHIYTAGAALVDYVMEKFGPSPRVFNIATRGVQRMLEGQARFARDKADPCDVVLIGDPVNEMLTPERLRLATHFLRRGAGLVGVCADRVFSSPRGIELGGGAFGAMFEHGLGVKPVFAGKPQAVFFHELCRRLGVRPEECVLIGDNLESDIAGGRGVGMRTALVLTGVARRSDAENADDAHRPDLIIEDLTTLLE